jgi:hypothetical protein
MIAKHPKLLQKLFKEVTNTPKDPQTRQVSKEKLEIIPCVISDFFGSVDSFKNDNEKQQEFFQDLALLIIKKYLLT